MAEAVARARLVELPAEKAKARQKERNLKFHRLRSQHPVRPRTNAEVAFATRVARPARPDILPPRVR
eukprot:9478197-Lingulodinium_polyedra.AAC.1